MRSNRWTRRQVMAMTGGASAVFVTGCIGNETDDTTDAGPTEPHPDLVLNGVALRSSFPMELTDPGGDQVVANVHWHEEDRNSHWHFQPLVVSKAGRTLQVHVFDYDYDPIPLGGDSEYGVAVEINESESPEGLSGEVDGDELTLSGEALGTGEIRVGITVDGDSEWWSPPLAVRIAEDE